MEKQYKVLTPNKGFNGRRLGVVFKNGMGMASESKARLLVANFKYACPELAGIPGPATELAGTPGPKIEIPKSDLAATPGPKIDLSKKDGDKAPMKGFKK